MLRMLAAPVVLSLAVQGCSYRLPVPVPPSERKLRLVARNPSNYTVRVENANGFTPSIEGIVEVRIPAYRPTCGVYLFNFIRVGGYSYPRLMVVDRAGKVARIIPLDKIPKLPLDKNSYYILKLP